MLVLYHNALKPTWLNPIRVQRFLPVNIDPSRSTRSVPDPDGDQDATMSPTPNGAIVDAEVPSSMPVAPSTSQNGLLYGTSPDGTEFSIQSESSTTQTEMLNGTRLEDGGSSAILVEPSVIPTNGIIAERVTVNGSPPGLGPNGKHPRLETDKESEPYGQGKANHVIRLSGIEHCMPRSYIRMCLAYRLPNKDMIPEVEAKLNDFVRRTVDAKPYLSGFVVAVDNPGNRVGAVEIRFSNTDFLEYPKVRVRHFEPGEIDHLSYDQLCEKNLPPSLIKPEIVSVLKESADEDWAPVFRTQANVIDGGIIISVYLHHCISDGTGIGLLMSGSLLHDEYKFDRHLEGGEQDTSTLSHRLEAFADRKSHVRNELSLAGFNQINNRQLKWKSVTPPGLVDNVVKPLGRGCVFAIPLDKLEDLKTRLQACAGSENFMSRNDVLMAFIWHGMTKARIPSLAEEMNITKSRLNIPVDIRKKLKKRLSESYFGAAVDFASTEMPLSHLGDKSDASISKTALAVRTAIISVDEPYIRQAIALAMKSGETVDVRDLQGTNMDRADGADMYITSWEKLNLYEATFGMGLGQPDWVRKPWSRDPGSCIILPFDQRKDYLEVVIQMAVADMGRLLDDCTFMKHVSRWIE